MKKTVLLCFFLSLAAFGQTGKKPTPPALTNLLPKDHVALYREFFYFHGSMLTWLAVLKANRTEAGAADLDNKAAAAFALTVAGHGQLAAISAAVALELRAIDRRQNEHANARAHYEQPPLPAMLQQFESERQDAVNRGMARLRQNLPADVWLATQSYINGTFRDGIRVK